MKIIIAVLSSRAEFHQDNMDRDDECAPVSCGYWELVEYVLVRVNRWSRCLRNYRLGPRAGRRQRQKGEG